MSTDTLEIIRPSGGPKQDDTEHFGRKPVSDRLIEGKHYYGAQRTAMMFFSGGSYDNTVRNCRFSSDDPRGPGNTTATGTDWLIHGYDVVNMTIEGCRFDGTSSEGREGHCIYLLMAGTFTARNIFAHSPAGQAIQLDVGDRSEMLGVDQDGPIVLENINAFHSGWGSGRGAFPITIRGSKCRNVDVLIDDSHIESHWPEAQNSGGWRCHSTGGITIYGDYKAYETPDDYLWNEVVIRNTNINLTTPLQWFAQIRDARHVRFEKCRFFGTDPHMPLRVKVGVGGTFRPESIVVTGCKGNVPVHGEENGREVLLGNIDQEIRIGTPPGTKEPPMDVMGTLTKAAETLEGVSRDLLRAAKQMEKIR